MNIVLDTNCLLMSLSRRSPYYNKREQSQLSLSWFDFRNFSRFYIS